MASSSTPASAGSLELGQRIGKYRLTEKLGEGGMGVVFVGVHEDLGREAAIKLLHAEFSRHPEMIARFQKEAEAVSRIGHPNIVAIYDFGRLPDGSLYYVMERILGETLRERLSREPPPEAEEIFHVISQIGRALQAAHAIGIVHRDLKPENILLEEGRGNFRRVKVLDFGIAKIRDSEIPPADPPAHPGQDAIVDVDEDTPPAGTPAVNLTLAGSVMGTPLYMSPEQAQALPNIDGRADLYALGAMLYETLTGQPPFVAEDTHMILIAHMAWEVVPPSQRARFAFPVALDPFLLRALAKAPADRFPDANTFVNALREAWQLPERRMTDRFTPILVPAPPSPPSSPQRRVRGTLAVAAAAVVLAASAGVFVWRRWATAPRPARDTSLAPDRRSPAERNAAQALEAVLGSVDPLARRDALEALADIAHPCMLPQVLAALSDPHPEVRRAAVAAASALADPAPGPSERARNEQLRTALAQAAQRSGGIVAVEIAAARWHAGDRSTRALLEPALAARDPALRLRAALALAEPGQFQTLRAALAAAPPSTKRTLRWAAARRLLELGDAAYRVELEHQLDAPDPAAQLDAAMALGQSKRRPPEVLVALADRHVASIEAVLAAGSAAALGRTDQIPRLVSALAAADPEVRAQAAIALGRLHGTQVPGSAQDALSTHLGDSVPAVRAAVAAALLARLAAPAPPAPNPANPAAGSPP